LSFSAAILLGGLSKRLHGQNKAFINICDKPLVDRQLEVLLPIFSHVFFVDKKNQNTDNSNFIGNFSPPLKVFYDKSVHSCALAGIHTALAESITPFVFIFSCDMPFLSAELIRIMIDDMIKNPCKALIPIHDNGIEPLHAIYNVSLAPDARQLLIDNKLKISHLFNDKEVRFFDVRKIINTSHTFLNINTFEDIIKAQDICKTMREIDV